MLAPQRIGQGLGPDDSESASLDTGADVNLIVNSDGTVSLEEDPDQESSVQYGPDGGAVVDLFPGSRRKPIEGVEFDSNLAEYCEPGELSRICSELLDGIQADDESRKEWLETRAKGVDMLGMRLEEPRGDAGVSSAPMEGMSTVRHPLLPEAVIRFQSNASAELLPAGGPVKIRNDEPPQPLDTGDPATAGLTSFSNTPTDQPGVLDPAKSNTAANLGLDANDLAEALERDFNHYLTSVDRGYRGDTDRMLFWVGFGGVGFKKVYVDPIRRIPLSRSVDAADLIVSNACGADLQDARRVTQVIKMKHSTMVRMQLSGNYRKINGVQAQPMANAVEEAIALAQGLTAMPRRPEDSDTTVYECYCELDLKGFEHEDEEGEPTGLPVPYRVTIDKDAREILEIRRNWKEDDEDCLPRQVFVKFPFVPAFGFYEIGLLQILGNTDKALTAAWRLMLDSGMFANFPGFLMAESIARQNTNLLRVPPGAGVPINTGGKPIDQVVMALPYKDIGQGLAMFSKMMEEAGQRIGGTAELPVAEGRQDAPVGTTLAVIEQATKMLAAVHVRLHAAQSEEFQLLRDLFVENPESFWKYNRRPARQWEVQEFLDALNNYDIVPAADPNTPSHMHRIMKAVAIKQLQAMNPQLYDARQVDARIMRMIGVDPQGLFAPPAPPQQAPLDPKLLSVQQKAAAQASEERQHQIDAQNEAANTAAENAARQSQIQTESADRAADRASRERVALTRDHTEKLKALADLVKEGFVPASVLEAAIAAGPATPPAPAAPGAAGIAPAPGGAPARDLGAPRRGPTMQIGALNQ